MDHKGEQLAPELSTMRAEEAIRRTLDNIDLKRYLSEDPGQRNIAIFGAGVAVEVGALRDYFESHGLGTPKIAAFDKDPNMKKATEKILADRIDENFEYEIKDLSNPDSLNGKTFDLIVVRNPDVHNSEEVWKLVLRNGFDHLKAGGIMLVSTDVHQRFVELELGKNGKVLKSYAVPSENGISPYFNERNLYVARKRDQ